MEKFYKEFYASRLEDWKNKYIKLLELRKLVKLIVKDIEKHGGKINRNKGRPSIIEDTRTSIQLDRHSVGLSALDDKENLFNKNTQIFESTMMYDIENTFEEINKFAYSDDIKIFLYFLQIEVHNVYVFYLSQEKEIYTKTNEHLYKKKKIKKMNEDEILEELNDLIDIAYLTYSFYLYVDLNIEAVHQILKYFDEHFMSINNNTSLHKLYFNKYLSQNESDLKYILSFKIVIDSTVLLESYGRELIKIYPNNSDIKKQGKELNEVLSYLISKNTDRINEDIYEVYNSSKNGGLIKQKRNVDVDIQNSYYIDIHKADDYLKRLEEKQYDKKMKIRMTISNKINIIILFFYIIFNSVYYIIPYFLIYFNYSNLTNNNKYIYFKYLGIILCSTHIGTLISRFIYSSFSKFKKAYIFYCLCFLISFIFMISSSFFDLNNDTSFNLYLNTSFIFISRFLLGLSNERIITRKYLILFTPESQMRFFSAFFLLLNYFGLILGTSLCFFIKKFPEIINIKKELFIYILGLIISFFHFIIILIFFTEPNKDDEGNMLTQQILNISQVTDDFDEEEYKKYKDNEKKDERYKVKEENSSINNQTKSSVDYLTFQENNKVIKIDKDEEDEDTKKLMEDKNEKVIISKKEIQGLNSIEKDIILMNENSNFDDINLVGNELERIKNKQIKSNNSFRKSFFSFIITLILCNMINEYILIKIPFILININKNIIEKQWIIIMTFIILMIFNFPYIVFFRIIKKFDIEKRLLLVLYILSLIIIFTIVLFNYFELNKRKIFLIFIFINYFLINCLEGITHLLIEKIIPSFVKFCGINMKNLFAYSIHIGKGLGGISFFLFYLFFYENINLGKFESFFFLNITFIFFFISFLCYKSLRVRAFAKLRYNEN